MTYFNSREVAGMAITASLWGVLNSILSPVFFRITGMPFLCDLIGFSALSLAAWWIRKFGAITMIGLIATAINFIIVPGGFQFLGFTGASVFFDLTVTILTRRLQLEKASKIFVVIIPISIASAAIAGYIIGVFFVASPVLNKWGGAFGWAGLHSIGGIIGGSLGASLTASLSARRVISTEPKKNKDLQMDVRGNP